jgi:hypothetical protein
MKSDFILDKVEAEAKKVFNYVEGRITFNADIFWVKSSIGEESINLFLETYQIPRDFKTRGIVEVVPDDKK